MALQTGVLDRANPWTLASLGIVAYVSETQLHEAAGHGSLCALSGGEITLLAPLFMQCSVSTLAIVAAGPAMNILTGLLCFLALRNAAKSSAGPLRYLLWLAFMFNGLVAAGYLLVGALTGFGDWSVLFASIQPAWLWRVPAAIVALSAYWAILQLAARLLKGLTGLDGLSRATRTRLILVSTGAAAAVALAAQVYGQGLDPLGLALALGCTLGVGLSVFAATGHKPEGGPVETGALHIGFSLPWLVAAGLLAAVFVVFLGAGADLSAL